MRYLSSVRSDGIEQETGQRALRDEADPSTVASRMTRILRRRPPIVVARTDEHPRQAAWLAVPLPAGSHAGQSRPPPGPDRHRDEARQAHDDHDDDEHGKGSGHGTEATSVI